MRMGSSWRQSDLRGGPIGTSSRGHTAAHLASRVPWGLDRDERVVLPHRAQRPDDENRDGDHDDRPGRIIGQGKEVGDDDEARDAHAEDAGPGRCLEQAEADGEGECAQGDVDPALGGEVELEKVVPCRDEDVVVGDLRDAAHDVDHAADHEHDGREDGDGRSWPIPVGNVRALPGCVVVMPGLLVPVVPLSSGESGRPPGPCRSRRAHGKTRWASPGMGEARHGRIRHFRPILTIVLPWRGTTLLTPSPIIEVTVMTETTQRTNTAGRQDGATSQGGKGAPGTRGNTTIADTVVAKIAGMAAREIPEVYTLGGGMTRAFGAVRQRVPGGGGGVTQGVKVEVGERQAAVDLDVVVEYGAAIADTAADIRTNVINAVERMTGLEVVEVNIAVGDVHLPDEEEEESEQQESRRVA